MRRVESWWRQWRNRKRKRRRRDMRLVMRSRKRRDERTNIDLSCPRYVDAWIRLSFYCKCRSIRRVAIRKTLAFAGTRSSCPRLLEGIEKGTKRHLASERHLNAKDHHSGMRPCKISTPSSFTPAPLLPACDLHIPGARPSYCATRSAWMF